MLKISKAVFTGSSVSFDKCPAPNIHEFAFIGRSNVGKSSLINSLLRKGELARISSKPGKTRVINHYLVNDSWYLVDLPGYGYARISKEERQKWNNMIQNYLLKRPNLVCVFVLIDARIEPQKNDVDFINWLGKMKIPFVIVFTKTDKISGIKINSNINLFTSKLLETWAELPQMFTTSAVKYAGIDQILDFIEETLKQPLVNEE